MNAVFFDWNGTLLADSMIVWRTVNITLDRLGKKRVSLATYRAQSTMPVMEMYRTFGCTEAEMSSEVVAEWVRLYREDSLKARLRRGARTTLRGLQDLACEKVILSNYMVAEIAAQIERFGIHSHFDTILANTAHDTQMKTGKIGRLEKYIETKPGLRGIIIGDTTEEIEIARSHQLTSVAITDGVCSTARLRAANPDYLIRTLQDLPKIASEVFERRAA